MTENEKKQAAKAAQKAYHKAWRSKNKERVKTYNENYWIRKITKLQEAEKESGKN